MTDPDSRLVVRVSCVGHASRRWKGAHSSTQADALNQQLSDIRADSVRRAAEEIIRQELPDLSIAIPAKGVGINEPFPTAGEDNAAVDRSVLVTVELALTDTTYKSQAGPPRKAYVPSAVWALTVLSKIQESAGVSGVFLRIRLQNPRSGKSFNMSGYLFGGTLNADPEKWFNVDIKRKSNPGDLLKPVGREVSFTTSKAMDFDDWRNGGAGQSVRMFGEASGLLILKSKVTMLEFRGLDTKPWAVPFESDVIKLGLSMPSVADTVVAGTLKVDGGSSSDVDYLTLAPAPDIIPTEQVRRYNHGLLLSFPTGKSSLYDLLESDRKSLRDFVTLRSRAIGALAQSYRYTP